MGGAELAIGAIWPARLVLWAFKNLKSTRSACIQPSLGSPCAQSSATRGLPAAACSSLEQQNRDPELAPPLRAMEQPAAARAAHASPLTRLPPELLQHCFSFLDDDSRHAIDSRVLVAWHSCWIT